MNTQGTPENKTLFQTFEWHTPSSPPASHESHSRSSHYGRISRVVQPLSELGVTSIWLPPGCKANNPQGNGYDIYDLWDLGEFDQKGNRSTKWGSREELDDLMRQAVGCGMEIVWDAVINHKQAGDATDEAWAVEVDKDDRRYEICPPRKIEAWLRYEFPGREREGMKYSKMKWRAEHFNGTDWDQRAEKNALYKLIDDPASASVPFRQPKRPPPITKPTSPLTLLKRRISGLSVTTAPAKQSSPPRRPGKGWADDVDKEHGNNDYLLFSNVDYTHPEVRKDVFNWGQWMVDDVGIDGFRLDAVQHFSFRFTKEWILQVNEASRRKRGGKDIFVVGEVWTGDLSRILPWLDAVQHSDGPQVYAYDSPLVYNFSRISEDVRTKSKNADLRTIIQDSVLQRRTEAAVTLVTNHDTQPGQTCYTPMNAQLKALFYAFILLRKEGLPCVFWGDLFGTKGPHAEPPACLISDTKVKSGKRSLLPDLILCRKLFAHGEQKDFWDSMSCIGWTRAGTSDGRPGCAVVISIGPGTPGPLGRITSKKMMIGKSGDVFKDVLCTVQEEVRIDTKGSGVFPCRAVGVAVWVKKDAKGAERFPVDFELDVYGVS